MPPAKKVKSKVNSLWVAILKPGFLSANLLLVLMVAGLWAMAHYGWTESLRYVLSKDEFTLAVGDTKITAYLVLKTITIAIIFFWIAAIVSSFGERRIGSLTHMRVANRTLMTKLFQIAIYVLAFLIGMNVIGIDLTALAVFSGAVGIGLGFGLQKIASNFISGIILLMEKAIEVGDLVELSDGTFGFIRKNSARHTLVETFDGKEIMIPNEEFITNRVTNWTYTNTKGRVDVLVGVSYNSDIELASLLIKESALEHPRCIQDPEPKVFLRNFGDSSVDFTLFFWVDDVTKGRWEPQSEVMFTIWKKFKDNNIEIPFPQQDVHIVSAEGLKEGKKAKTTPKGPDKRREK